MKYDEREIMRYLGVKPPAPELAEKIVEAAGLAATLTPQYVYATFDVDHVADGVFLRGTNVTLTGALAKKHFWGCAKLIVVLATLGLRSEVLQKRTFSRSAEMGVILDATYTVILEKYLDEIEDELTKTYGTLTTRVSCGYGDLPLAAQADLFRLLEGERLGVRCNECMMLTPNKSVIAIVGAL